MGKEFQKSIFRNRYVLNIQNFAEDDIDTENDNTNLDNEEHEENKISLTQKQLEDRLARERKKAIEEAERKANENISEMIAKALKEHDENVEKQKSFEKMTDEERENAKRIEREKDLEKRENELKEQLEQIKVSQSKNIIMSNYDKDQLPRRDLFESIAEVIAVLDDEKQAKVYSAFKGILEEQRKSLLKDALKQKPPKDGSDGIRDFQSTRFAQQINKENENKVDDIWGE